MAEANPWVIDVTTATFDTEVLERSDGIPILVDFWAPWCAPCRTLGPVLERFAHERAGQFILAKVNTEAEPSLGSRYRVRSIPAVKLFHRRQVIGEFVGALQPSQVQRFLDAHVPTPADDLVAQAHALLESGESIGAREKLREALEADEGHAPAHLALAKLALVAGDAEIVEFHVGKIGPNADAYETARHVRDALRFARACEDVGGEAAARERIAADPGDLDARFGLAGCLAQRGLYEEALEAFLEIVKRNRRHRDEAARKAMLTIFGVIGRRSKLTDTYVRQLQIYT